MEADGIPRTPTAREGPFSIVHGSHNGRLVHRTGAQWAGRRSLGSPAPGFRPSVAMRLDDLGVSPVQQVGLVHLALRGSDLGKQVGLRSEPAVRELAPELCHPAVRLPDDVPNLIPLTLTGYEGFVLPVSLMGLPAYSLGRHFIPRGREAGGLAGRHHGGRI